jgi:cysteine-rich repeat protein
MFSRQPLPPVITAPPHLGQSIGPLTFFIWVGALTAAGCLNSETERCPWGTICPPSRQCHAGTKSCLRAVQIEACQDTGEGRQCSYAGAPTGFHVCQQGACLPVLCGDGTLDKQEACDDGNGLSHDGCSSGCTIETPTWAVGDSFGTRSDHGAVYFAPLGGILVFGGQSASGESTDESWVIYAGQPSPLPTPVNPSARHGHAMTVWEPGASEPANEDSRPRVVLFGGWSNTGQPLDDTWVFVDEQWQSVETESRPPARADHAMVQIPALGGVVLFGGRDASGAVLDDVWCFDGIQWRQLFLEPRPMARFGHTMVWDPDARRGVLFGGTGPHWSVLDDTWELTEAGFDYLALTPAPAARTDHAMAYDPETEQILLAGGSTTDPSPLNEVWLLTGRQWEEQSAAPLPAPRTQATLAYDTEQQSHYLLGGTDVSGGAGANLWQYSAGSWQDVTPAAAPPPRSAHSMDYMQNIDAIVLFGGYDGEALNDTWLHDGRTWQKTASEDDSPPARFSHDGAYDEMAQRLVLFGGIADDQPLDDTWIFDGTTWQPISASTPPSARYGHAMAYDPQRQIVVLFGGNNGAENLSDTWIYTRQQWEKHVISAGGAPSEREHAAMVYVPALNGLVLHGGRDDRILSDSWLFDGTTWTPIESAAYLPERCTHAMAYDTTSDRLIMFGGFGTMLYGDTWSFDGQDWQNLNLDSGPAARARAAMAYHPTSRRLVLFGGTSTELKGDSWTLRWESGWPEETCLDRWDNDEDGLADCQDPDCENRRCDVADNRCLQGVCQ